MSRLFQKTEQVGGTLEDKGNQLPVDSCSISGPSFLMGDINKEGLEFQKIWAMKNKKKLGASGISDFGRPIQRYIEHPGLWS